jgi:uncharacterized repeat protein (TIGR04076 family)
VVLLNRESGRIKVTVLKLFDTAEGFSEAPVKAKYDGPCPIFKEGQEFYVDDIMPSGF